MEVPRYWRQNKGRLRPTLWVDEHGGVVFGHDRRIDPNSLLPSVRDKLGLPIGVNILIQREKEKVTT